MRNMANDQGVVIKIFILLLILILSVSLVVAVSMNSQSGGNIVSIVQDGELIERIDLSCEKDRTFTIMSKSGGENVVCIENGSINISSADCPDQTCVHMGKLKNEANPIVCLPNKLIIRFDD